MTFSIPVEPTVREQYVFVLERAAPRVLKTQLLISLTTLCSHHWLPMGYHSLLFSQGLSVYYIFSLVQQHAKHLLWGMKSKAPGNKITPIIHVTMFFFFISAYIIGKIEHRNVFVWSILILLQLNVALFIMPSRLTLRERTNHVCNLKKHYQIYIWSAQLLLTTAANANVLSFYFINIVLLIRKRDNCFSFILEIVLLILVSMKIISTNYIRTSDWDRFER